MRNPRDDTLSTFLDIPAVYADNYEIIKAAILFRAGVSMTKKTPTVIEINPKPRQTAASVFSALRDTLNQVTKNINRNLILDHIVFQYTYSVVAPHIAASVRSLKLPMVRDAVQELGQ